MHLPFCTFAHKRMIIAVLNSKGGSGKTTLATNVATALHRRGHSVLVVDSDPQGSARDWHEAHPEEADLPPVVGMDRATLHRDLPTIGRPFDYVIIDGAAKLEEVTASAVRAADFVLIPVRHSGFDLWAVESLVESIRARQTVTGGRPGAAFVISCQTQGSRLARSVDEALADFGLPVLKARTAQRVAYEEAAGVGLSVFDLEGRDKAAAEIDAITSELIALAHHVEV